MVVRQLDVFKSEPLRFVSLWGGVFGEAVCGVQQGHMLLRLLVNHALKTHYYLNTLLIGMWKSAYMEEGVSGQGS